MGCGFVYSFNNINIFSIHNNGSLNKVKETITVPLMCFSYVVPTS